MHLANKGDACSLDMRLARGHTSHFHAGCLFRTTFPICDLHEIEPLPRTFQPVVPRFSVLHGFIVDFIRMAWTLALHCLWCWYIHSYGCSRICILFSLYKKTRRILLMRCVPLCHGEIE
jgi:hypothetical protein